MHIQKDKHGYVHKDGLIYKNQFHIICLAAIDLSRHYVWQNAYLHSHNLDSLSTTVHLFQALTVHEYDNCRNHIVGNTYFRAMRV